ncbi:peptidase M20 [Aeromonas phage pAh6.2TG]|uniref:Peptidase M20 n=2 Tax=Phayathaivirus TaxID=3153015 RepID=A0A8F3C969_9CAUD|nr:peptidase M20 [Aeromonas phage pAh6.2TG]YP_010845330.1 hypothetical protein QNH09_gp48 [Aeromonas phage PVN03]QLI47649.1 peptidase M20 [Aeromonas phage PVN02]QTQ06895.1 hypothetical protein [Aeromonas phage PVN04]QTQ06961.1 hypothetical protein [Aeromonas phage PVN05]QTQ06830.1 hypothetical protein [Aeromonas phage PVN03]QWY14084.1 peptidase M20 [Aeromonas phage pAh6.2TG]
MSNTQETNQGEHPTVKGRVLTGQKAFEFWRVEEDQKVLEQELRESATPAPETG